MYCHDFMTIVPRTGWQISKNLFLFRLWNRKQNMREEHLTSCYLQKVFPAKIHLAGKFWEITPGWQIWEQRFEQIFIYFLHLLIFHNESCINYRFRCHIALLIQNYKDNIQSLAFQKNCSHRLQACNCLGTANVAWDLWTAFR